MATLIDLHNRLIKYNGEEIYIAIDDNTNEPWFQGSHICKMLKYIKPRNAIRVHIDKKDKTTIDKIVKKYKELYKNIQGHTIFINEAGLYALIFSSKNKEAKKIKDWIAHDVLPNIRKFGEYKIAEKQKEQLKELQRKYNKEVKKRKLLEHDMRTFKYKKGGVVYIVRTISDADELDINELEKIYLKFGETDNMTRRKTQLETTTHHKVQVLNVIYCKDRKMIESCVKKRLEQYIVRKKKDYIYCSYNELIAEIAECIKFFEGTEIDTKIKLSRTLGNKKVEVEFMDDTETFIEIDDYIQKGGEYEENESYMKYLRYKLKYLELKYGYE
jgi:prophage antirepressor-like protein